jgi:hypothetical protein
MRIYEIILEDAEAGTSMAGNFASIAFPLFGKEKMIRRAVDPNGYLGKKKNKKNIGYPYEVKNKK